MSTASVLLLNAGYEPLGIITHRRALSLMLRGRVEPACDESFEMRGASSDIHIPTVIRLRYYVNVPQRGIHWSRQAVFRRDQYICGYCGLKPGDKQRGQVMKPGDFTIDHILPVSRGGKSTWGNTVCACPVCNQRKADRLPNEAGMKLLWEPKTPRSTYLVASGDIPASWKIYLKMG
ncbi:MAG: HNH endonuclease [Anaerolineae bacterium]|nr:HNH endonuclease [Anaerolineae bacterium]